VNVTILGAGSWGRTVALLLIKRGHRVTLWGRANAALAAAPYDQTHDLNAALQCDVLAIALPVQQIHSVLVAATFPKSAPYVLSLAKGIEQERLLRVSQICTRDIPGFSSGRFAALSGPTLADEVARGLPATAVVASESDETAKLIQHEFSGPALRLYTSRDLTGVELAGALKNVIALAAGICAGLKLGQNVLGALVTRGLTEMTRLGEALGGQSATFSGLAGLGDLVTTCTSSMSRNRTVGERIAGGEGLDDILQSLGEVAEGVWTATAALEIAKQHSLEMPITAEVCRVLYESKDPTAAIHDLMTRSLKSETDAYVSSTLSRG
jgi:glycerol-3-phosphate dehydrogenase (NAD(P)+)